MLALMGSHTLVTEEFTNKIEVDKHVKYGSDMKNSDTR
jgi:hypothetical protein